jgi:hypothetical protein
MRAGASGLLQGDSLLVSHADKRTLVGCCVFAHPIVIGHRGRCVRLMRI